MALASAIEAVIGDHVALFYERDSQLLSVVGAHLAVAARQGDTVIVVATARRRRMLEAVLESEDVDLEQARAAGRFVALDAAGTLAAISADGQIDRDRFDRIVGDLVRRSRVSGDIRVYGEMVALLWDAGDIDGVIALESLWNELLAESPLSLICSYAVPAAGAGERDQRALELIARMHSAVVHPAGPAPGEEQESAPDYISAIFPPRPEACTDARQLTMSTLRRLGYDEDLVERVAIVVSELASNAVLHAATPFSLVVAREGSQLRIAVEDGLPLALAEPNHGLAVQRLHGLALIDAVAQRWGVEDRDDGKVVWAELAA